MVYVFQYAIGIWSFRTSGISAGECTFQVIEGSANKMYRINNFGTIGILEILDRLAGRLSKPYAFIDHLLIVFEDTIEKHWLNVEKLIQELD